VGTRAGGAARAPAARSKAISLEEIAEYPLITYDAAFAGRSKIDHAFELRGLKPDVLLEAIDADVIKTYVELGMGVGIIAGMAFDPERDRNLRAIPVGQLFGMNVSRVAVKQGAYLRSYIYTFIELLAPMRGNAQPQDGRVGYAMRGYDEREEDEERTEDLEESRVHRLLVVAPDARPSGFAAGRPACAPGQGRDADRAGR
jgi:LysR family cys regulon transcriptional activator